MLYRNAATTVSAVAAAIADARPARRPPTRQSDMPPSPTDAAV